MAGDPGEGHAGLQCEASPAEPQAGRILEGWGHPWKDGDTHVTSMGTPMSPAWGHPCQQPGDTLPLLIHWSTWAEMGLWGGHREGSSEVKTDGLKGLCCSPRR